MMFEGDLYLPEGSGLAPDKVAARNAKIGKLIEACDAPSVRPGVRLEWVSWQWLYCYGSRCCFSPSRSGRVYYLLGANGSGKSSFNEVVSLALFGKDSDPYVVNVDKPPGASAWAEASVEAGGETFVIRREFDVRGEKLSQTASVLAGGSGAVVVAGAKAVSDWICQYITPADFALMDRRDADLLGMKPAEQKAVLDGATQSGAFIARLEAVREARNAYKWMADGLGHARDAIVSAVERDPSDDDLVEIMRGPRAASEAIALCRAQLAFARAADAAADRKTTVAKRLTGGCCVVARPVAESEVRALAREEARARLAAKAADSALADIARREPPAPRAQREDPDYLSEKVERYRTAVELFRHVEACPSPYDERCSACVARHGADAARGRAAAARLAEMNIGDAAAVAQKLRGYEARLARASRDAEAARARADWNAELADAQAIADAAASDLRTAEAAAGEAFVAGQLFDLKLSADELRAAAAAPRSGISALLRSRLRALEARHCSGVAAAADLKAVRKHANREREGARRLAAAAEDCSKRAALLKEVHESTRDRFRDAYCDAAKKIADAANSVLRAAYDLELSAEWDGSSVIFRYRNAGGPLLPADKASGFERAAMSLAVKAALRSLRFGASCGWLVVDEATHGFDGDNAGRLSAMLDAIARLGATVVALVTSGNAHAVIDRGRLDFVDS